MANWQCSQCGRNAGDMKLMENSRAACSGCGAIHWITTGDNLYFAEKFKEIENDKH